MLFNVLQKCLITFQSNLSSWIIETWKKKEGLFSSCKVNDLDTTKMIKRVFESDSYLLDPHTAVAAVQAFEQSDQNNHYVLLSTAHPAKFPKVYEELGIEINCLLH